MKLKDKYWLLGKMIILATKKVNVNTIGEINLKPKIKKALTKTNLFRILMRVI